MKIGDIVKDINPNNMNELEVVSNKIDLSRTHLRPRKIIKDRRVKDRGAPRGAR